MMLLSENLKNSGITQATLASRLGKSPEVVCRLLSRPQNWESDTFSNLLFAISGGVPRYGVDYPFSKPGFAEQPIFQPKTALSTTSVVRLADHRPANKFKTEAMVA